MSIEKSRITNHADPLLKFFVLINTILFDRTFNNSMGHLSEIV